jgi:GNAT superfamily N-acetyltransferase
MKLDLGQVEYVVVDPVDVIAQARLHGVRIGYAHCVRTGDRLLLGDINVLAEMPVVQRTLGERVLALFMNPDAQRLRHRGIGSELLERVLHEADEAGIQETWGCVKQEDLAEQPTLLRWYERHGFVVQEPDSECLPGTVKKIVRRR